MNRKILTLICFVTFIVYLVEGGDLLRFPERLSLSFKEFSVDSEGTLHGKLDEFWGNKVLVGIGADRPFVAYSPGQSFKVELGEEFRYHYSRAPVSSLRVLKGDDPEIESGKFPNQMRGERYYLRIMTGGIEAVVGVVSQKAYFPKDGTHIDFHMPFKTVWSGKADYDLWSSGVGFRSRFKKVDEISEAEKQLATDLHRYFSMSNLVEITGNSCMAGTTNVHVSACDALNRIVAGKLDSMVVQVSDADDGPIVTGLSFVVEDECRHARRYRYDAYGRFSCGERKDRANGNGVVGRMLLDMSFEYDVNGILRRAWTPGDNPLMIDKGDKLYFTGNRELAIKYRQDVHQSLEGLPRLK